MAQVPCSMSDVRNWPYLQVTSATYILREQTSTGSVRPHRASVEQFLGKRHFCLIASAMLQKTPGVGTLWLFENGLHIAQTVFSYPYKLLASPLADLYPQERAADHTLSICFSSGTFSKFISSWFKLSMATLKPSQLTPVFSSTSKWWTVEISICIYTVIFVSIL